MFTLVSRGLFVALLVAAVLPAGVCEAACEQPAPPPCHGEPLDSGHDAHDCPSCDQPATLSSSEASAQLAVAPAAIPAAVPAAPLEIAARMASPRDPPGSFLEPFARSKRPLLS